MATFTCITCHVAFADADLQRSHYKTDWHRYNLKRKVTNLPHVTAEAFNQRVLAQQAEAAGTLTKQTSFYCEPCGKKLSSKAAWENHNQSSKHHKQVLEHSNKEEITKPSEPVVDPVTDENLSDWDEDLFGIEECLFCSKISNSLEMNIKHMTKVHNFFIPDIEYLTDLEGLITYLGEKVGQGKMCLWCNDRSKLFHSIKAAQQHMMDKGHCMLHYEGEAAMCEYADFYDYTTSYPAEHEVDADDQIQLNVLEADDDFELTLPSGTKIGHRTLMKYYKQNLIQRSNIHGKSVLPKVLSHYKALGWTGCVGAQHETRVKDLQLMQRTKLQYWQKLGVKANKTSQKHFRNQIMF